MPWKVFEFLYEKDCLHAIEKILARKASFEDIEKKVYDEMIKQSFLVG